PTGTGEWLILSVVECQVPGANKPTNFVLTKLDSSFNIIWEKEYGAPNLNDIPLKILVEPDGYLMAGGRNNENLTDKYFTFHAQLIKVDTGGSQQWSWL